MDVAFYFVTGMSPPDISDRLWMKHSPLLFCSGVWGTGGVYQAWAQPIHALAHQPENHENRASYCAGVSLKHCCRV